MNRRMDLNVIGRMIMCSFLSCLFPSLCLAQTNQFPTVSIVNPRPDFFYSYPSVIKLHAEAADPDGVITNVAFHSGMEFLGKETNVPYVLWLTNHFEWGQRYSVVAEATDNLGAQSVSEEVSFVVVQDPGPSVRIVSPEDGETFSSNEALIYTVTVNITDDAYTRVDFMVDGMTIGMDLKFPFTTNLSNISIGHHTLQARAFNNIGSEGLSQEVTFTISDLGLVNPEFTTNGLFAFTVEGVLPGRTNVIETSTNFADWLAVHTNVSNTTEFVFTDPDPTHYSRRFYRAKVLK